MLYAFYPVRLSRFAVFLTLIVTAVFGLTMTIIPLVYLVNLNQRPRYALVYRVPDYSYGDCFCGCSYFINATSLVRIVMIGASVVFTSCLSAFRCLKGLRRAQWANLMSVLFPIPLTVYNVFWTTENGEPIEHRKEGEPVQSELAFDPFALMDEQPDSRFMTVKLKPEPAYEKIKQGHWKPFGDRGTDGPKVPELEKGQVVQFPTERIGCCGFPCLTGGQQTIFDLDEDFDKGEPCVQPRSSLERGGLSPQVVGVDSLITDQGFDDSAVGVRSKNTQQSSNQAFGRRSRGESNISLTAEDRSNLRLQKHMATLRVARGAASEDHPGSRTNSPTPSPQLLSAEAPAEAPKMPSIVLKAQSDPQGAEQKVSL